MSFEKGSLDNNPKQIYAFKLPENDHVYYNGKWTLKENTRIWKLLLNSLQLETSNQRTYSKTYIADDTPAKQRESCIDIFHSIIPILVNTSQQKPIDQMRYFEEEVGRNFLSKPFITTILEEYKNGGLQLELDGSTQNWELSEKDYIVISDQGLTLNDNNKIWHRLLDNLSLQSEAGAQMFVKGKSFISASPMEQRQICLDTFHSIIPVLISTKDQKRDDRMKYFEDEVRKIFFSEMFITAILEEYKNESLKIKQLKNRSPR